MKFTNNTNLFCTFFSVLFGLLCSTVSAQKDTAGKQSVEITSSYKPVLRNAVKILFSASHVEADTNKMVSPYSIPQQNLFYAYQPIPLKPLALQQDTALQLGDRNFVKAGFGNFTTPYFSAGISLGDGRKTLLNIYADVISSKGNIKNQDYLQFNTKASGSYFTSKHEIYGTAAFSNHDYFLYGYDNTLYEYNKNDLLQRYQQINIKAGIRNKEQTEFGITYNPAVAVSLLSVPDKAIENSLVIDVPVQKSFDGGWVLKVTANGDFTKYSSKNLLNNLTINNNIYSIAPEVAYTKNAFNIHAGVTPTWDNGKLNVLPNIVGEVKIKDELFIAQAGFVGRLIKNNYQHLSRVNPFLQTISAQQNTREIEIYGGIKAAVGSHFNFSAKAGMVELKNMPFFINDTLDGKTFAVSSDSKLNSLRIHADMSYINKEIFMFTGGVTFNGYSGMQNHARAWGNIPLEASASLRWRPFKQLLVKSDAWFFSATPFLLNKPVREGNLTGADVSAGLEFAATKKISVWLDVNNIFNNRYQRWKNYQVYGLNVLGGVIVRF